MNIRKILFIILFIIVSFYLLGLLTGPIMFFNKKSKSYLTNEVISKPISNIFLPINGSYSLAVGEGTPLNFTYIYSSDKKDLFNEIYSINLSSNEDSISIESFEVDGNAKVGKYHIKTVVLNIVEQFLSWCTQFIAFLVTQQLSGFFNGTIDTPSPYIHNVVLLQLGIYLQSPVLIRLVVII